MTTFLGVLLAATIWTVLGIGGLAALGWWASKRTRPTTSETPPSSDKGVWETSCTCDKCQQAPQPHTVIAPGPRTWGHVIPRDNYCHAETGDCICEPDEAFTYAGPIYLHNTVKQELDS